MKLQNIKLTNQEKIARDTEIARVQEKQDAQDAFVRDLAERLDRGEITSEEFWTLQFKAEKGGKDDESR